MEREKGGRKLLGAQRLFAAVLLVVMARPAAGEGTGLAGPEASTFGGHGGVEAVAAMEDNAMEGKSVTETSKAGAAWRNFTRPSKEELKKTLTAIQYEVTQEDGTERAFSNPLWDNKKPGLYVDIVSGEPLFSSLDKYDSNSGWPSFTRPVEPDNIVERADRKFLMVRTEVRSRHGDSHLGHVFGDGPPPTGMRYCINSAALRFIPKEDLEREGYGEYLGLFE